MHVGYCDVYSYSFRLFFDAWSKNSWNSLFVLKERKFHSPERKFQGTKVLGIFASEERKFHGSERSREQIYKGNESFICVLFAPGNESAEERKVRKPITPNTHGGKKLGYVNK